MRYPHGFAQTYPQEPRLSDRIKAMIVEEINRRVPEVKVVVNDRHHDWFDVEVLRPDGSTVTAEVSTFSYSRHLKQLVERIRLEDATEL